MTSASAPKEIPQLEERLPSRFESGLMTDIQLPDFETRLAILKKKAEIERVRLADDVAYLIVSRIKANVREIEGSLTRMIAFCSLSGREMSIDVAQDVLSKLWGDEEPSSRSNTSNARCPSSSVSHYPKCGPRTGQKPSRSAGRSLCIWLAS